MRDTVGATRITQCASNTHCVTRIERTWRDAYQSSAAAKRLTISPAGSIAAIPATLRPACQ